MTRTDTVCGSCERPTSGAILCDRCTRTLAICLVNVAAYYDELEVVATKRSRYGSGGATKGSIGKEQPLPADGRFLDVTGAGTQVGWDVWRTVVAWCRTVMVGQPDTRDFIGPVCKVCIHPSCTYVRRNRWPRGTVRAMVAYLDRQFRWIVRQDWAPQLLDELLDCERRMRRLIDRPADRWYAGKCPALTLSGVCGAELYALVDSGTITCDGCGTEHDVASRRDFLLEEAKDYPVTATEAAKALLAWTDYEGTETKLVDRISKWRDREKLKVLDVTSLSGRDRHLYRLGDIQALLIGDAQDAQSKRIGVG